MSSIRIVRWAVAVVLVAAALGAAGCTGPAAGATGDPTTRAEATGTDRGVLTDVTMDRGETDQVVFTFDTAVPGYRIEYAAVSDTTTLIVELSPASTEGYAGPDHITTPIAEDETGVVEGLTRVTDDGSRVVWAIAMRERVPFTVDTISAPARLVIELSHED